MRTLGGLIFGDTTPSNDWTIDNSGLTSEVLSLAVSSGSPIIQVNDQTATIRVILGGQNWIKAGNGTLILTGWSNVGATINSGTLQLGNANGVWGLSVNVNGGLAFSPAIGTFAVAGFSGSGNFSLTDTTGAPVTLRDDEFGNIYSGVLILQR